MMGFSNIRRMLIGEPFPTSHEHHERLDKVRALAIFASDPISSNAYATEAIMSVLIVMGSGALSITLTDRPGCGNPGPACYFQLYSNHHPLSSWRRFLHGFERQPR